MKKVLMILALILPLTVMSQEVKEEVVVKQGCIYNADGICISCQTPNLNKAKQFRIKKEIRFGRGDEHFNRKMAAEKCEKMQKKLKIRQIVRVAVVGGLAYYMGYHEGEKHFKGGMKRRPGMGNKK